MAKATAVIAKTFTLEMSEDEVNTLHDLAAKTDANTLREAGLMWLWDAVCELLPDRSATLGDYQIVKAD